MLRKTSGRKEVLDFGDNRILRLKIRTPVFKLQTRKYTQYINFFFFKKCVYRLLAIITRLVSPRQWGCVYVHTAAVD